MSLDLGFHWVICLGAHLLGANNLANLCSDPELWCSVAKRCIRCYKMKPARKRMSGKQRSCRQVSLLLLCIDALRSRLWLAQLEH